MSSPLLAPLGVKRARIGPSVGHTHGPVAAALGGALDSVFGRDGDLVERCCVAAASLSGLVTRKRWPGLII